MVFLGVTDLIREPRYIKDIYIYTKCKMLYCSMVSIVLFNNTCFVTRIHQGKN